MWWYRGNIRFLPSNYFFWTTRKFIHLKWQLCIYTCYNDDIIQLHHAIDLLCVQKTVEKGVHLSSSSIPPFCSYPVRFSRLFDLLCVSWNSRLLDLLPLSKQNDLMDLTRKHSKLHLFISNNEALLDTPNNFLLCNYCSVFHVSPSHWRWLVLVSHVRITPFRGWKLSWVLHSSEKRSKTIFLRKTCRA